MGGIIRRADLVDQRDDSSTGESSLPSYRVQRPQRPHVRLPQLCAGLHTHAVQLLNEDWTRRLRQRKAMERKVRLEKKSRGARIRQQAEEAQDL